MGARRDMVGDFFIFFCVRANQKKKTKGGKGDGVIFNFFGSVTILCSLLLVVALSVSHL